MVIILQCHGQPGGSGTAPPRGRALSVRTTYTPAVSSARATCIYAPPGLPSVAACMLQELPAALGVPPAPSERGNTQGHSQTSTSPTVNASASLIASDPPRKPSRTGLPCTVLCALSFTGTVATPVPVVPASLQASFVPHLATVEWEYSSLTPALISHLWGRGLPTYTHLLCCTKGSREQNLASAHHHNKPHVQEPPQPLAAGARTPPPQHAPIPRT